MFESLTKKLSLIVLLMLFSLTLVACNNDEEEVNEPIPTPEDPLEVFARNYALHNTEPKIKKFKLTTYTTEMHNKNEIDEDMFFSKRIMYGELYADYLFHGTLLSYKSDYQLREEYLSNTVYSSSQEKLVFYYKDNYIFVDQTYTLDGGPDSPLFTKTKNFTYGEKNYSKDIPFSYLSEYFWGNIVDTEELKKNFDSIIFKEGMMSCVYEGTSGAGGRIKTLTYFYDKNYQIYKIERYVSKVDFQTEYSETEYDIETVISYDVIELSDDIDIIKFDIPEEYGHEFYMFSPVVLGYEYELLY